MASASGSITTCLQSRLLTGQFFHNASSKSDHDLGVTSYGSGEGRLFSLQMTAFVYSSVEIQGEGVP